LHKLNHFVARIKSDRSTLPIHSQNHVVSPL
jgi:hypothetical protein